MTKLKRLIGLHKSGNLRDEDLVLGILEMTAEYGTDLVLGELSERGRGLVKDWVARVGSSLGFLISGSPEAENRRSLEKIRAAVPEVTAWFIRHNAAGTQACKTPGPNESGDEQSSSSNEGARAEPVATASCPCHCPDEPSQLPP